MIDEKYKHSELTGKIIGCAMEVHKYLGNGFQEVVYQRALSIELNIQGIAHVREQEMPISHKCFSLVPLMKWPTGCPTATSPIWHIKSSANNIFLDWRVDSLPIKSFSTGDNRPQIPNKYCNIRTDCNEYRHHFTLDFQHNLKSAYKNRILTPLLNIHIRWNSQSNLKFYRLKCMKQDNDKEEKNFVTCFITSHSKLFNCPFILAVVFYFAMIFSMAISKICRIR